MISSGIRYTGKIPHFVLCVCSRIFENQPNRFCSHFIEKGVKRRQKKLQIRGNEGKGKENNKERGEGKEENRKKATVSLLVFIVATLEIFGRKIPLDAKDPFGGNVI